MKSQAGKTALQLLLTITILLIIAGAAIAMIFGGTDIGSNIRAFLQKDNSTNDEIIIDETEQDESVQTEENKE